MLMLVQVVNLRSVLVIKAGLSDVLADAAYAKCWLSALFFTHVVTLYLQVFGHFGSDFKFLFEKLC
jgi:hypothetical protein